MSIFLLAFSEKSPHMINVQTKTAVLAHRRFRIREPEGSAISGLAAGLFD